MTLNLLTPLAEVSISASVSQAYNVELKFSLVARCAVAVETVCGSRLRCSTLWN